jgi:hypothetical protein
MIVSTFNTVFQLAAAIASIVLPDYCGEVLCAKEFTINKAVLQIVFVIIQLWNVFDGVRPSLLFDVVLRPAVCLTQFNP